MWHDTEVGYLNYRSIAISAYSKTHSVFDTSKFIERFFGRDTPKDDAGHWYKTEGAPCPHGGEDVTEEYKRNAKPGKGVFKIEPGVKKDGKEKHEAEIAEWLHREFGGDMIVLEKKNKQGEKEPDYLWRGKYWELQTPEGKRKNLLDDHTREGIRQIRKNPGGIIMDLNKCDVSLEQAEKDITHRMERSAGFDADVFILYKNGEYKVIRHKKKPTKS